MQDRMYFVLNPCPVPDDLVASGYQSPQTLGVCIRQPDLGGEIGRAQRRQNAGVDLVGLDCAWAIAFTCIGLATMTRAT
jgi:hypothetical protein